MDSFLLFLKRNQWARRALSGVSILLLVGAVGLLGYPVYTNFRHDRLQKGLSNELASAPLQQRYRTRSLKTGDALTRINIPAIGVSTVVVEGTTPSALRAGAGHYPGTPLPCEAGNMGIAGHRTTFGKPFANIDQLKPGDEVVLEIPLIDDKGQPISCTYQVLPTQAPFTAAPDMNGAGFVVKPDDLRVVAQNPGDTILTLTSCHPKGSAKERVVVQARLVKGGSAPG